jgi:hypothetical protein
MAVATAPTSAHYQAQAVAALPLVWMAAICVEASRLARITLESSPRCLQAVDPPCSQLLLLVSECNDARSGINYPRSSHICHGFQGRY